MEQAFTSPAHPRSNGKLERFHRAIQSGHIRQAAYLGREDAVERMKKWILYYNGERLHGALFYLPPDDVFFGRGDTACGTQAKAAYCIYQQTKLPAGSSRQALNRLICLP
jgi:hypothetical protein